MSAKLTVFYEQTIASAALGSILAFMLDTSACRAQPGSLDTNFIPQIDACAWVSTLAPQGDGKILYAASIQCIPGSAPWIGRLNTNGTLDSGFTINWFTNGATHAIVQDSSARILVGGSFSQINSQPRSGLARLKADGALDTSFAALPGPGSDVLALAIQNDGRILIGGQFTNVNVISRNGIARLQVDGSLDPGFNPGSGVGSTVSNEVHSIKVLPSGKVLLAGAFTNFNGIARGRIVRLNTDGSVDPSFDPVIGANQVITTMAVQTDGKVIVGGEFTSIGGITRRHIARLNEDGSLDATFDPDPGVTGPHGNFFFNPPTVSMVRVQQDGQVLVAGAFGDMNAVSRSGLARLNADGSLDYDFDAGPGAQSFDVSAMILQNNGQIVVAGPFSSVQNAVRHGLARLNATGLNGPGRFELSSAQFVVNEGDGNAVFTVLRTGGSQGPATVFYSTQDGTARAPARYVPTLGVLSFTNGEVRKEILVPIVDDHIAENQGCCSIYIDILGNGAVPWEVFSIALQNPTGGAIMGSQSYSNVEIEDNDTAFSFNSATYSFGALDGLANVTVERLGNRSATNTVICSTQNGTARAGLDYAATNLTLVFAPGEASKTVRFAILENPLAVSNATLSVTLSNPTGGAFLMDPSTAQVTIQGQAGIVVSKLPGAVDTTFIPGTGFDGSVYAVAYHTDGKLLVAGAFSTVDGIPRPGLARMNLDGSVDQGFDPGTGADRPVRCLVAQPDGMVLIGGNFGQVQSVPRKSLARLKSDGSLDLSFDAGSGAEGEFGAAVYALALQSDGQVIVGGSFTNFGGMAHQWLARLNSDGSLDAGFNPGSSTDTSSSFVPAVQVIGLQADGKIVIAGSFSTFGGIPCGGVARLNPDGSRDSSFNATSTTQSGIGALLVQSDNKVVLGGWMVSTNGSMLVRLSSDGGPDDSFQPWMPSPGDVVTGLALQKDGKLLAGGSFTTFNGVPRNRILRLNSDGRLDITFDPGSGADNFVQALGLAPSGNVAIGGDFTRVNGRLRMRLAQLLGGDPPRSAPTLTRPPPSQQVVQGVDVFLSVVATGFPLPAFQWTLNGQAIAGATTSSLTLSNVVVGQSGTYGVSVTNELGSVAATASLAVLPGPTQAGALDLSFYPGFGVTGSDLPPATAAVTAAGVNNDGKVLIGGVFSSFNGVSRAGIAQLNADGSIDTNFDPGSGVESGGDFEVIAFQPDGKALIAGWFFFTINNGRIGTIARLNSDGSVDSSFHPQQGAGYTIHDMVVQSDGKILIGGEFSSYDSVARRGVARVNSDGSLDSSFDPGTSTNADLSGAVFAVALQTDGKVVVGGNFNYVSGQARAGIARLNSDGRLDSSFNPAAAVKGTVEKLAIQTDGKILLAGVFSQVNGTERNGVARLNTDGSLDSSFDPGAGAGGPVWALAVQNYGRILIGGSFTNFNGVARNGFARLNPDGSLDQSMDPGAGADAVVYALALQGDGRVIIGGSFTNFDNRPRSGIARLLNDATSAAGQLEFSLSNQAIPENSTTNLLLHVRRVGASNGLVQVQYGVSGGTAVAGANFSPVSGTLVFSNGVSGEQSIPLAVVDDHVAQGDKTIDLWLGKPLGGAVWGTNAASVVTIIDNDVAFDFATNQITGREDQLEFVIEVRRLGSATGVAGVNYATIDDSAKGRVDYVATSGTLTFLAGETNKLLVIPIVDDWLAEENEKLRVSLSQPTGGAYVGSNSPATLMIVDTHRPGTADASFVPWTGPYSYIWPAQGQVNSLALLSDGRILAGGDLSFPAPIMSSLVRLLPNGLLDTNYQASLARGLVPTTVSLVRAQPDGKALVVTGDEFGGVPLMRLTTNGLPDASFNPPASISLPSALELQADGKILVGSISTATNGVHRGPYRLRSDGSIDPTFSPPALDSGGFWPSIHSLAIDHAGKIWIAGAFTTVGGVTRYGLARLQPSGSLDLSFDPGPSLVDQFGTRNSVSANSMVVQADGKLIVGGNFAAAGGSLRTNIARFNTNGTLDSGFKASVTLPFSGGSVSALALQQDGRILVAGTFAMVNGVPRNGIARLLSNGSLDTGFHSSQDNLGVLSSSSLNQVSAMVIQPDGQILIGGSFYLVDGQYLTDIARINGTVPKPQHPLLGIARQPNGKSKVSFTGAAGQSYLVAATTNLTEWVILGSPSEPTKYSFEFEDPDSDKIPQRQYRVVSP